MKVFRTIGHLMLSKILEKPPKRLIIPFCGPNVDRFYDV
jgi:hypothetical protein